MYNKKVKSDAAVSYNYDLYLNMQYHVFRTAIKLFLLSLIHDKA